MLINSIIYSTVTRNLADSINYYIIDYGSESLRLFEKFPQVGDIVFSSEDEKLNNLIKMLKNIISERKKMFSSYGGEYNNYIKNSGNKVPLIGTIINNYDAFSEINANLEDEIIKLCRDGLRYGMFFIITANTDGSIRRRIKQNFSSIFALRLNDISDYNAIFNKVNSVPKEIDGRGLFKMDEVYEFQTASIVDNNLNAYINRVCEIIKEKSTISAKRIPTLPKIVSLEFVSRDLLGITSVPIGVTKQSLEITKYDFTNYLSTFILSNTSSNTVNFSRSLIMELSMIKNIQLIVIDLNKELPELKGKIKYYYDSEPSKVYDILLDYVKRIKENIGLKTVLYFQNFNKFKLKLDNMKLEDFTKEIKNSENILEVIKRHDDKYGPGHALKQLRAFFDIKNEKYMDYNLITKSGGAREILLMYTPQQIAHALENLNYINSPVYVSGYFSRYGSSKEAKYGCDQGGIESLCTYTYNGRKYTYEQAMVIFNSALNSGRPLPHFKKEATPEYFFLKNKLVSQGFSSSDASIIMSTINDAGACSYAATVNEIFRAFAGKEVEFQQKFGYSMYKIENGKRRLNFNELLLDLYVHANKAENGGGFILADNRLNPYLLNRNRHDVFGRTMLDAKQQVYLSYSIDGKNESVIANFLIPKGIDWYRSFKIASNYNRIIGYNDFSNILNNVYLEMSKGHSVSLDIFKGSGVINMKSTNEGLYPSVSTNTWSEGGGHSVFVTGIGSNGFYVSSWGREYLIPFADLQNGGYFTINCSVIGFS